MLSIEVKVKGQLNQKWSEWFSNLTIRSSGNNETCLSGIVSDQAALYGIISHLRDLGLPLISVSSFEIKEDSHECSQSEG